MGLMVSNRQRLNWLPNGFRQAEPDLLAYLLSHSDHRQETSGVAFGQKLELLDQIGWFNWLGEKGGKLKFIV